MDGHMKLADFGISRVLKEDETDAKGIDWWTPPEVIEAGEKKERNSFQKEIGYSCRGYDRFLHFN